MRYLRTYRLFESRKQYTRNKLFDINDILLELEDILDYRILTSSPGNKTHLFVDWDGTILDKYDHYTDMTIEIAHKENKFTGTVFIDEVADRLCDVITRLKEYLPSSQIIYNIYYSDGDSDYVTNSKGEYTSDINKLKEYFYPQNSIEQIDIEILR